MKEIFILGINGSPIKNGETAERLKQALNGAKRKKAKIQLIHLIDKKINPCLGCYSISAKKCRNLCVQKDGMQELYPLILKADGIIFASPAYWFSVSGILKNFLDRMTCMEVNDLLEGKIAGAISVAEETGGDEVVNYLIGTLNEMGFLIPPFGAIFFNKKGKVSWRKKDLENLGENMVKLAKILKKDKLNFE